MRKQMTPINRRELLKSGGVVAGAIMAGAGFVTEVQGEGTAVARRGKPNILMFHVDNVSIGDFVCYGGAYPLGAKTPHIDRFANESLMLTNYNVEAQCTPSRSALMTGRHPVRTGCISALPGSGLVAWEVTIADKLKELGYSNACYGKWHCGEDVGRLPKAKRLVFAHRSPRPLAHIRSPSSPGIPRGFR